MLTEVRNWLIKLIAGKNIVVLNAEITPLDGGTYVKGVYRQKGLIENNHFMQPLTNN